MNIRRTFLPHDCRDGRQDVPIRDFDQETYQNKLQDFFQKLDLLEDGHTSERVANVVLDFLAGCDNGKNNKKRI